MGTSIDKQLASLDPLTRAVLTRSEGPEMTADEAEAIVRARESRTLCDLRVGWQVQRAREARQPLFTLPAMRLPGPITREAHEFDVACRARAAEMAPLVFAGFDRILAMKRTMGAK